MGWKIVSQVEIPEGFTLCTPKNSCSTCKFGVAPHQETHFFKDQPDGSQVVRTLRSLTQPSVDSGGPEEDIENDYKSQEERELDRIEEGYERQRDRDATNSTSL